MKPPGGLLQAFLKVYLQKGDLFSAQAALRAVVASDLYSLMPAYQVAFIPTNPNNAESLYEFPFECNRWHDILRMGTDKAIHMMNNYFMSRGSSKRIGSHDLLHPIPVSVIEVTKGNVQQNPGY